MRLSDHAVIVTGAASGLGAATARCLAGAGADVACLDRDADRGATLAAEIGAAFFTVDVTDPRSVGDAVSGMLSRSGRITALVNCAGIATADKLLGREGPHALDRFQRTLDINLTGTFNMMRLAAEAMARNAPEPDGCRGVIVNTASIAAYEGQKGQVAYAASKGGVAAMTLPAARDLASQGIRVNAIAPGLFMTPMLEGLGQDVIDGLAADVTFPKRLGEPGEFAELVGFLLQAGYLNGEVIRLDGALRMR